MLAKRLLSLFPVVLIVVLSDACVQRSAVNADCIWTEDADGVLLRLSNQTDLAHLSDDAAFAEDLAIRYADVRKGHRSGHFETAAEYGRTRDACMAALFAVIADEHGVRPAEVRDALMHRPLVFDLAVFASFFVLYGWIVFVREMDDRSVQPRTAMVSGYRDIARVRADRRRGAHVGRLVASSRCFDRQHAHELSRVSGSLGQACRHVGVFWLVMLSAKLVSGRLERGV